MECIQDRFKDQCICTYEPCERKARCCECMHYHRRKGELPACFFTREYEKTFDRSISNFIKMHRR